MGLLQISNFDFVACPYPYVFRTLSCYIPTTNVFFTEKCLISWKCKTAYNFASVNRLDNSACYVQWKRDTGETFLVLLSGQSREVEITCGMQKLAKLRQFACRMTFRSLCPRKKNARKLPKGVLFIHVHSTRKCSKLGRTSNNQNSRLHFRRNECVISYKEMRSWEYTIKWIGNHNAACCQNFRKF